MCNNNSSSRTSEERFNYEAVVSADEEGTNENKGSSGGSSSSTPPLSWSTHSMMTMNGIPILPFPLKLHALLEEAETLGFDDVIAWMPDGRSFRIFDKDKLEQQVMPKFFNSCKYKTFQRSLNFWGFETAKSSIPSPRLHDQATFEHGCRYHPFFIRGRQEFCSQMKRVRVKRGASKGETAVSTPTLRTSSTSNKMMSDAGTEDNQSSTPTTTAASSRSPSLTPQGVLLEKFLLQHSSCKQQQITIAHASTKEIITATNSRRHHQESLLVQERVPRPPLIVPDENPTRAFLLNILESLVRQRQEREKLNVIVNILRLQRMIETATTTSSI